MQKLAELSEEEYYHLLLRIVKFTNRRTKIYGEIETFIESQNLTRGSLRKLVDYIDTHHLTESNFETKRVKGITRLEHIKGIVDWKVRAKLARKEIGFRLKNSPLK